jgi:hypothetical protein
VPAGPAPTASLLVAAPTAPPPAVSTAIPTPPVVVSSTPSPRVVAPANPPPAPSPAPPVLASGPPEPSVVEVRVPAPPVPPHGARALCVGSNSARAPGGHAQRQRVLLRPHRACVPGGRCLHRESCRRRLSMPP